MIMFVRSEVVAWMSISKQSHPRLQESQGWQSVEPPLNEMHSIQRLLHQPTGVLPAHLSCDLQTGVVRSTRLRVGTTLRATGSGMQH